MKRVVMLLCSCLLAVGIVVPLASADSGNGRDRHGDHHTRKTDCTNEKGVCGLDKEYIKESTAGDLFEIQGGKIADSKSTDPATLKLANTLIKDHSKSYEDTVKLAKDLGIDYSKEPSPTEQWELKAVSTFSGEQFNHWYALLEVKDHQQDIQLAEDEVKDGCNEKVRNNAKEELPVLRYHLELAEQALKANP